MYASLKSFTESDCHATKDVGESTVLSRPIRLDSDQHVALHNITHSKIRSLDGTVWITQDGDLRDIVLEPGESFTVDHDGTTVISAVGAASICVSVAPEPVVKGVLGTRLPNLFSAARNLIAA